MNGNARPDLLRHNTMNHHIPQGLLGMNPSHLFPSQQQPPPSQLGQQQPPPPHMNLLPAGTNPNPSLGLMPPGQPNASAGSSVYQLQMQQVNQHRRQIQQQQQQQQAMSAQGLTPQSASGPPHVNGISHNALPGMSFPNSMMQQQSLRRVTSQPLGQPNSSHIPGMHPNQNVVGGMQSMAGLAMAPQGGMPSQQQLRQQQMRIQQQPHPMQGPSHMSPDFLNRQAHMQNNVGMPGNIARAGSTPQQLLGSLAQSSALSQSHQSVMQSSLQNQPMQAPPFQNSLPMNHSQLASSPRAPTAQGNIPNLPSASGAAPQSAVNSARMTPESPMFFQSHPMAHPMAHNPSRLPTGNNQFPFAPSSTPPSQLGDISQALNAGNLGAPAQPSRTGLMATPAQALEQMSQGGDPFPFTHPISAPPRPPSQHAANSHFPSVSHPQSQPQRPPSRHTPVQSLHSSPAQPDHQMLQMHTQRPQSQPQVVQSQSPQAGPSRTPHVSQASLPSSGASGPGLGARRQGGQLSSGESPPSAVPAPATPTQTTRAASRPPTSGASSAPPVAAGPAPPPAVVDSATAQAASQASSTGSPARPLLSNMSYPVGFGQGLTRLLQFSGVLAIDTQNKLQLSYWDTLIKEYFTPKASLKFTLWKDNQRNEAKPFEIGVPILPRFFLVTSQSGVKSMNLSLDGARERIVSHGHAVVECVQAVWTYRYTNGYTVTLRGPMTAHIFVLPNATSQAPHQHVSYTLKFDQLQFDANFHDKLIAMEAILGARSQESPRVKGLSTPMMNGMHQRTEEEKYEEPRLTIEKAEIPAEPVNAFGIPQATMRCLELAESVAQMSPLIQYSTENKLGPLDALSQYAKRLREVQGPALNGISGPHVGFSPSGSGAFENGTGVPATPPVTLYPGTPLSSAAQIPASASTPNGSLAGDAASKQNKTPVAGQPPPPPATPNAGPANAPAPASAPTPTAATTTPSMAHTTLKRKAQDGATSASSTPEVAPKRQNRKRGRTGGG